MPSSAWKKKTNNLNIINQERSSPFCNSLSPFIGLKPLPSTARNTLSQATKINTKNLDQVSIGHFTPISINITNQKNSKNPFQNKNFGVFDDEYNNYNSNNNNNNNNNNNTIKTPDSVSRKLGKRGGSDAKKCQTPSSFLGSSGKNKKKIRNK